MRRTIAGFLLRFTRDLGLHRCIRNTRLTAFVAWIEARYTLFSKSLPPTGNRGCRGIQRRHDLAVNLAVYQCQNEPSPEYFSGRQSSRGGPLTQLVSLFIGHCQHKLIPSHDYPTDQSR
jgi:hypothetical protein